MSFCDRLISLSVKFFRFVHVVYVIFSFLKLHASLIACGYSIFIIHSSLSAFAVLMALL